MPFTFCHPLAVVPLRRFCPGRLNFAALVIGSMSPDFGYYILQFRAAGFAHTFLGTLAICLPSGLVALAVFHGLRRPLCYMLPRRHRLALMPGPGRRAWPGGRAICAAALSVLLGAWTHVIWDAFTHDRGWLAGQWPILQATMIEIAGTQLSTAYILQQSSTLFGGLALVILYYDWLAGRPPTPETPNTPNSSADALPDSRRYLLLAALALIALAIAIPAALAFASDLQGHAALRAILFRTAILGIAIFIPLVVMAAILLYAKSVSPVPPERSDGKM